jgi:signal transduction histidine kinase
MLGQFLDIHRLEEGRVVRRAPTPLLELLRDCGRYDTHRAGSFRVEVTAPDAAVSIDPELAERAIANLLFNAVRYAGHNGVIRLSGVVHEDAAIIDICNTGEPPPPEARLEVFDKFRTGPTGQRGLGLYFCRLVCRAHGGDIELTSSPGFPTVFRMLLPVAEPPDGRTLA